MKPQSTTKPKLYKRYPLSSVLLYNGATLLHFGLGAAGIMIGYRVTPWAGYGFGALYLALALAEMYVAMPFTVCRHCAYYRMTGSRCISALNLVAQRLARPGHPSRFANRAKGVLCPNNLYMASLIAPIVAIIPALIVRFSWLLLAILIAVAALLLFRFFVIFSRVACVHCSAKHQCPQARAMGV